MFVRRSIRRMLRLIRVVGGFLLSLAAVILFFAMKPEPLDNKVEDILSEAQINNSTAQGAPQQAVVNGWTARDLLSEIAKRPGDDRPAALLLITVLGLGLMLCTSEQAGARLGGQPIAPSPAPTQSVHQDAASQAPTPWVHEADDNSARHQSSARHGASASATWAGPSGPRAAEEGGPAVPEQVTREC